MAAMNKQILIVANMTKPAVVEQLRSLRPWLEQQAEVVDVVDAFNGQPDPSWKADLCIVLGGDGTLLAAARMVAMAGIPLVGVNMGKLGFLADFSVEHMQQHLQDILLGKVPFSERMMLQVCAGAKDEVFTGLAANDLAVVSGPPYRMIELHVSHGEDLVASYLGDGVVVSTPTGSTGYNLSLGGPIMEPSVSAMIITPIAPHSLSMRPIVVPSSAAIRITAQRVNAGTTMVIDGQISRTIGEDETLEIHRSIYSAKVITHPGRWFFKRLTEKLQWGTSPHHQ